MSAARVEQLKTLLARVQERRAAPRLRVEVPMPVAVPSPAAVASPAAVPSSVETGAVAREQPVDTSRAAVANTVLDLRQVPVTMPEPPSVAAPLVLEDLPLKAEPVRKPETDRTTAPTVADLPPATPPAPAIVTRETQPESLPPVVPVEATRPVREKIPEPAPEAPLTAPSARVEAPLLARTEPVVRVVSSPRIEAPKNFGDLLEASLSLRPR